MQALYLQALLGAGLFTFLPGRMRSRVLFGQTPRLGFGCAVFILGVVYWYWRRRILRLELSKKSRQRGLAAASSTAPPATIAA